MHNFISICFQLQHSSDLIYLTLRLKYSIMENGTENFIISYNCLNSYQNIGAHTDNGSRCNTIEVSSGNSCPL